MKHAIAIIAALTLTACQTETLEERVQKTQTACQAYGFKPGTEEMAFCVKSEIQQEKERRARTAQAYLAYSATRPRVQAPVYQIPQQSTTTCRNSFGTVRCTHW